MAETWTELCANLSDEQFIAACKAHLRESRYFPSPAEILKAHEDSPPVYPAFAALPEHTSSPEELHKNAVSAAMCMLSMKNPEAREFFSLPDWEAKDAFARKLLGGKYPKQGMSIHGRCPAVGDMLAATGVRQ